MSWDVAMYMWRVNRGLPYGRRCVRFLNTLFLAKRRYRQYVYGNKVQP